MRYWHWSQRRSYCSMPPFQEVLEEFEGIQKSVFFSFSNFSVEVNPPVTLCAHSWTKCDASEVIWTCSLSEMRATEWSKCSRCQAGATTKPPSRTKTFEITPSLIGFSDDFDHLPASSPSQPRCGEVPLLSSVWSAVLCRPVGSQPAAEWMRTDSPCIWPIVPSPGLGLESFLLAAPDAAARSKTSLLGRCRPSVCPRRSGRAVTSALKLCGMSRAAVWKDYVQRHPMGMKSQKFN